VACAARTAVVRVPRRVFQRLLPEPPTRERCVEVYYHQRLGFESTPRKLRRRRWTDDGNVADQQAEFGAKYQVETVPTAKERLKSTQNGQPNLGTEGVSIDGRIPAWLKTTNSGA
jgi:hypothetical protein